MQEDWNLQKRWTQWSVPGWDISTASGAGQADANAAEQRPHPSQVHTRCYATPTAWLLAPTRRLKSRQGPPGHYIV
jgi:hypothetical protein